MSSSPIDNVDWQYVVGEVALLRVSDPEKTCLMVEGQDDVVVYKRFIDTKKCQITNCYGKKNLVPAISVLNQQKEIKGYVAIKDADFDVIESVLIEPNVLLTDGHDLETMIINSPAFDSFIEVQLRGKDSELVQAFKQELRNKLFQVGCVIGYLHMLSLKHQWGIKILPLEYISLLDSNYEMPLEGVIKSTKSRHAHIDESKCDFVEFETLFSTLKYYLCRGHDLIKLLEKLVGIIARKYWTEKVNPGGDIAEKLLLAFDAKVFRQTQLFISMKDWESRNQPFLILEH